MILDYSFMFLLVVRGNLLPITNLKNLYYQLGIYNLNLIFKVSLFFLLHYIFNQAIICKIYTIHQLTIVKY